MLAHPNRALIFSTITGQVGSIGFELRLASETQSDRHVSRPQKLIIVVLILGTMVD